MYKWKTKDWHKSLGERNVGQYFKRKQPPTFPVLIEKVMKVGLEVIGNLSRLNHRVFFYLMVGCNHFRYIKRMSRRICGLCGRKWRAASTHFFYFCEEQLSFIRCWTEEGFWMKTIISGTATGWV